jgi:hypothetical protein
MDFGAGPTLIEFCLFLRDPEERHARILDVVERDSVIEGLPPFTPEFREEILRDLRAMNGTAINGTTSSQRG